MIRRKSLAAVPPRPGVPPGYPPSFLKRNRRVILTTFWVVFLAGTLITFFETPAYRSVARVLPTATMSPVETRDTLMSPEIIHWASVDRPNPGQLRFFLVDPPPDGRGGIGLAVEGAVADDTNIAANYWAELFSEGMKEHCHLRVLYSAAPQPMAPFRPNKAHNILFAALMGLLLGTLLGVLADGVRALRRPHVVPTVGPVLHVPSPPDPGSGPRRCVIGLRIAFIGLIAYAIVAAFATPIYRAAARLLPTGSSDTPAMRFWCMDIGDTMADGREEFPDVDGTYHGNIRQYVSGSGPVVNLVVETDDPKVAASTANDWAARCNATLPGLGIARCPVIPAVAPDSPVFRTELTRASVLVSLALGLAALCALALDARRL
jgi:hypothetical protein